MYLNQSQNVFMDYKDCKNKGRKHTCRTPHVGLLLSTGVGSEGEGKAMLLSTTNSNQYRNLQLEILHED